MTIFLAKIHKKILGHVGAPVLLAQEGVRSTPPGVSVRYFAPFPLVFCLFLFPCPHTCRIVSTPNRSKGFRLRPFVRAPSK